MPPIDNIERGPDTIRILLTTDNHVGYNENDPIRGDDSWKTFEEITTLAKTKDVDMVLQGGDLFHVNKPSKKSMYHVMRSLRANCLGNRPCELQLLSDPSAALGDDFNTVNYEDPNINVSVPVFAISGNHDDATGLGFLLPLDLLSVSGLINHFGKVPNNEEVTLSPLVFQKGTSKLALYGLANVKDERLHRLFRDGNVKFLRPNSQNDEWFNLLAVHQNHVQHSRTSYLPEQFLPGFLNFVLWGHEHECIPTPVFNPDTGFDTLQPGSSVATSLCEGEAVEKYVFILNIRNSEYSIEPIKLKTVRPFIMEEVSLSKERFISGPASKDDISKFLTYKVEELIKNANDQFVESNREMFKSSNADYDKNIPLPLVRLRVDYSGDYEIENPRRFSNKFVGKIANINDVVQFYKKKSYDNYDLVKKAKFKDSELHSNEGNDMKTSEIRLQDLMRDFLQQAELNLIPEDGINEAVKKFLENDDKHIMNQYIKNEITHETQMFLDMNIDDGTFHDNEDQNSKKVFKNLLAQIKREKTPTPNSIGKQHSENKENISLTDIVRKLKSDAMVISDSESDFEMPDVSIVERPVRKNRGTRSKPHTEVLISDHSSDIIESSDDAIGNVKDTDNKSHLQNQNSKNKNTRKNHEQRGAKNNGSSSGGQGRSKGASRKETSSSNKGKEKDTRSLLDDIMSMGN